ncbi:hypothetical protein BZA05DRAFT_54968 [Tricharina praecox]|uniref:uncharacterized protein n=1 Tax=Tricharina praecox TaxID=43433 RepID=UPI002220AC78|nr:uncharacterized protein BZA05DRAFT_54968 [Tricharina praecox]KAI5850939.1 hypothetical protein BZA05DRAFT_54968 [Tricharina praecox]
MEECVAVVTTRGRRNSRQEIHGKKEKKLHSTCAATLRSLKCGCPQRLTFLSSASLLRSASVVLRLVITVLMIFAIMIHGRCCQRCPLSRPRHRHRHRPPQLAIQLATGIQPSPVPVALPSLSLRHMHLPPNTPRPYHPQAKYLGAFRPCGLPTTATTATATAIHCRR